MLVGVTEPATGVWLFPSGDAARLVAHAQHAEALGIDELWWGDEGIARDPFAVCAAAAAATQRLHLAIGVTNPYVRHPAITGAAAATVHELAGGRFTLGLGAGGRLSLAPLGLAPTRPLTDCRAALPVIRAAAAELGVPHLPVAVGARGERFNRWASEAADGAFVSGVPLPLVDDVVAWARSVRPIRITLHLTASFDPDALEAARPSFVHGLVDCPDALRAAAGVSRAAAQAAAAALDAGDPDPARRLVDDRVVDLLCLRGTPAEVVAALAAATDRHRPDAIGIGLLAAGADGVDAGLERCADAFRRLRAI